MQTSSALLPSRATPCVCICSPTGFSFGEPDLEARSPKYRWCLDGVVGARSRPHRQLQPHFSSAQSGRRFRFPRSKAIGMDRSGSSPTFKLHTVSSEGQLRSLERVRDHKRLWFQAISPVCFTSTICPCLSSKPPLCVYTPFRSPTLLLNVHS